MKTTILSILILALSLPQTALCWDIKTRKGRVLRDCSVRGVTEDDVRIFYADGVTTVDYRDLPREMQQQLHYDAEKGKTDYGAAARDAYHWYVNAVREAERKTAERIAAQQRQQEEDARLRTESDLARREQEAERREAELQTRAAAVADQERRLRENPQAATPPAFPATAQQPPQAAQPQMSAEEALQMIALLQMMQSRSNGNSDFDVTTPYRGPTQYNGRPLPRNWIDPKQADTNFFLQQLQNSLRR